MNIQNWQHIYAVLKTFLNKLEKFFTIMVKLIAAVIKIILSMGGLFILALTKIAGLSKIWVKTIIKIISPDKPIRQEKRNGRFD